jgi:hypothetical protein
VPRPPWAERNIAPHQTSFGPHNAVRMVAFHRFSGFRKKSRSAQLHQQCPDQSRASSVTLDDVKMYLMKTCSVNEKVSIRHKLPAASTLIPQDPTTKNTAQRQPDSVCVSSTNQHQVWPPPL